MKHILLIEVETAWLRLRKKEKGPKVTPITKLLDFVHEGHP